jgi:hypothetical protein
MRYKSYNSNLNHDFRFLDHFTCNDSLSCSTNCAKIVSNCARNFLFLLIAAWNQPATCWKSQGTQNESVDGALQQFSFFLFAFPKSDRRKGHSASVPLIVLICWACTAGNHLGQRNSGLPPKPHPCLLLSKDFPHFYPSFCCSPSCKIRHSFVARCSLKVHVES